MKDKAMMKSLILLILTVLSIPLASYFNPANAAQVLFVAPTRLELSEAKKVEILNVTNVSDRSRSYKISVEDIVMTEQGGTALVESSPYSAKKILKFFPRQFTIAPGQRQVIRIMAKIPADTADGQFHSHIHFLEDKDKEMEVQKDAPKGEEKKGTGVKAPLSYSAMIPIIVTKGTPDTKVDWVDPKLSKSEKPNTYKMTTQLTRIGNGQGVAFTDAILVQPDGKETQIGKRHTAYIYREIDKRDYSIELPFPENLPAAGQIKFRLFSGDRKNPALVREVLLAIP